MVKSSRIWLNLVELVNISGNDPMIEYGGVLENK